MALQPVRGNMAVIQHRGIIEAVILNLGDAFDIRIEWVEDTAIVTLATVAGALLGGFIGGRMGAMAGAGIGLTGAGVAKVVALRELWIKIKDKLKMLFCIVYNFLRQLDAVDVARAARILMASYESKRELALTIASFIAETLGRQVLTSAIAA